MSVEDAPSSGEEGGEKKKKTKMLEPASGGVR